MREKATQVWPRHRRWLYPLLCAAGAAVFLGVAYLLLSYGAGLRRLWLPADGNNDVVIYSRQVAGVLAGGGQPEGVFGYNESRAAVGHFGAWGPVLILLYAVPALLTGTGVNMMCWCNVLLVVAGWTVFAVGNRLGWKRQLLLGAMLFCSWYPLQQVFTGTAEPLQFALLFCILGATGALQARQGRGWGWWLLLVAACTLTTITRAYTALLWIYPAMLLWKRRRLLAWSCLAGALAGLGVYFLLEITMLAPFFEESVDMTAFALLGRGQLGEAVVYGCTHLMQQLGQLWQDGLAPCLEGNPQELGLTGLLVIFLLVVLTVQLAGDIRQKRPVGVKACAVVVTWISLLALMEMYAMYAMSRHFIMLAVLLLLTLALEPPKALLPGCLLVLLPLAAGTPNLPAYDAAMDAQLQVVAQALQQRDEAQQSEDPWAHTLAYAFRDDVFHGYLYAVPDGMGIQFDRNTYLADTNNPIHSQYAMVEQGGDAEARLLADGWTVLVSTEDLIVYERPDAAQ